MLIYFSLAYPTLTYLTPVFYFPPKKQRRLDSLPNVKPPNENIPKKPEQIGIDKVCFDVGNVVLAPLAIFHILKQQHLKYFWPIVIWHIDFLPNVTNAYWSSANAQKCGGLATVLASCLRHIVFWPIAAAKSVQRQCSNCLFIKARCNDESRSGF
jgi:hypothetical protein